MMTLNNILTIIIISLFIFYCLLVLCLHTDSDLVFNKIHIKLEKKIEGIKNKRKLSKKTHAQRALYYITCALNNCYFLSLEKSAIGQNLKTLTDLIDDNINDINPICYKYEQTFILLADTIQEGYDTNQLLEDETYRDEINEILPYIIDDIKSYVQQIKDHKSNNPSETLQRFKHEKEMVKQLHDLRKNNVSTFDMINKEVFKTNTH